MLVDQVVLLVDTSRWPLAVLTYAGRPTNVQLEEHLKEIEEKVLARGDYFVQVIDQSQGETPDAMQRALIAQHQERMKARYTKYCLGEAYVVTPQIRGAMVAVFWLAKPPYPHTFVDTLGEAMAWARTRLTDPPRA